MRALHVSPQHAAAGCSLIADLLLSLSAKLCSDVVRLPHALVCGYKGLRRGGQEHLHNGWQCVTAASAPRQSEPSRLR